MKNIYYPFVFIAVFSLLFLNKSYSQIDNPVSAFPNIILLIGDGNGLSQISAGNYSLGNQTSFDRFEFVGLQKPHPADDYLLTDSAASGTAIATGKKTLNGMVGMDPEKNALTSILEILHEKGYKSALIATSSIVHATPAAFYAKVEARREYQEIAKQLMTSPVDIFIGGGKKHFTDRKDDKNLLADNSVFDFVDSLEEFKQSNSDKIGFLTYPDEPPSILDGREPRLAVLIQAVLEKLDGENPFFLMVEGSQIDWAGHANDIEFLLEELREFDEAINLSLDFSKKNASTLVIATADHETGGLSITGGSQSKDTIVDSWGTGGHTATFIPVFSSGYKAIDFAGVYDNTEIFAKLLNLVSQ